MERSTILDVAQPPPNVSMRADDAEKKLWKEAAKRDGFDGLATWIKWLIRARIKDQGKDTPEATPK